MIDINSKEKKDQAESYVEDLNMTDPPGSEAERIARLNQMPRLTYIEEEYDWKKTPLLHVDVAENRKTMAKILAKLTLEEIGFLKEFLKCKP
jgi:hypothetical protein